MYFTNTMSLINRSLPGGCSFKSRASLNLHDIKKIDKYVRTNSPKQAENIVLFEYFIEGKMPNGTSTISHEASCDLTLKAFLEDHSDLKEALEEELASTLNYTAKKNKQLALTSTASEMLLAGMGKPESGGSIVVRSASLALSIQLSTYSVADKAFFKWFLKDTEGNMYMKVYDGTLTPVPIAEGAKAHVADDNTFWSLFFKTHRKDLIQWVNFANAVGWDPESFVPDEGSLRDETFMNTIRERIHSTIPKTVMNRLTLEYVYLKTSTDEGAREELKCVCVKLNPTRGVSVETEEENWRETLSYCIANIDPSELSTMQRYSNVADSPAMHHINIDEFKEAAMAPSVGLPPTWITFLKEKFEVDKEAQLYRLAKFIVSCLDAKNMSRQCLLLCGAGNNGKTMLSDIIMQGLNNLADTTDAKNKFATSLISKAFDSDSTTMGLSEVFNSILVYVPDVSDLYTLTTTETFKNITGQDIVTANIKYRKPIQKRLIGTKILLSTNSNVYISNDFMESRLVPVYFAPRKKGDLNWNRQEMTKKMVAEFEDFCKWCFFFAKLVERKAGLSDTYQEILMYSSDSPDASTKEVFERITGANPRAIFYHVKDEDEDDLIEDIREVLVSMSAKAEPEGRTRITEFIAEFAKVAAENSWNKGDISRITSKSTKEHKILLKVLKADFCVEPIKSNGLKFYKGMTIEISKKDRKTTSSSLTPSDAPIDDWVDPF